MAENAADFVKIVLNAVQMRHNRILECNVRVNPMFGPVPPGEVATYEGLVIGHQIEFGTIEPSQVKRSFFGRVTVECRQDVAPNDKVAPYFFKALVEGFFEVPIDPPTGLDLPQLVAVNGAAALTAVVRELLASITSRGAHGAFLLPSLIFTPAKAQAEEKTGNA